MDVSLKPYCPLITRSQIAKLTKELQHIVKQIGKNAKTWRRIARKLNKTWGFRRVSTSGMSNYIYISKKSGIVLKCPYGASMDEIPQHAIYTRAVPIPHAPYNDNEYIFIQPLADVSEKSRFTAHARIAEAVEAREIVGCLDDHEGNVAVFNGKAVAIDW